MRRVVLVLALAGCGRVEDAEANANADAEANANADAEANADADADAKAKADADADADAEAEAGPDASTGCAPIVGSAPFGVYLEGKVDVGMPSPTSVGAMLFFPKGRVPGAPVVLATSNYAVGGFAVDSRTLDGTSGASGLQVSDPNCHDGIVANLVGPSGGLQAKVAIHVSKPSDAIDLRTAATTMCATSPIGASSAELPATAPMFDPMRIRLGVPVDPVTASKITVRAGAALVPLKVAVEAGEPMVRPAAALPVVPDLELDATALRDLLGRPYGGSPTTKLGRVIPTAVVADRTFASWPPTAAVVAASASWVVEAGRLEVSPGPMGAPGWSLIVALGDASPGSTTLRARHRFLCTSSELRAAVVSKTGASTPLKAGCATAFSDETVTLPGTGPYFLFVESRRWPSQPCWYSGGSEPARYSIDDITL